MDSSRFSPAGKDPSWISSPWLPVGSALAIAVAIVGLVLIAGSSWGPPWLWPALLRNYWLIAALSALTCFGLGRQIMISTLDDLLRIRMTGALLAGIGILGALAFALLVGADQGAGQKLGLGLAADALACGAAAAGMLGRRLMAGPKPNPTAIPPQGYIQPVSVPAGAKIPFDGMIVAGRSEVDEGPIGGSLLGTFRSAGDTVRRGARNGDGELTIEPLVESSFSPPYFTPAATFAPGFNRRVPLIFIVTVLLVVALALHGGGDTLHRLETALLGIAVAVPISLGLVRPLVFARARSLARSKGWHLNGTAAIEELADRTALVCGRGGVLTRMELEILAVHPAIGVESAELVAAATSITQSSQGVWARALARYAVVRKMLLAPIAEWSGENSEAGFGFHARTAGGQHLIAGSRDWIVHQGIRTHLLEAPERESLSPGRRSLWVAQLEPQKFLIGVIVAGERLKPGATEMCKNAKRIGLTGVMLDRRDVEGAAELVRYLGLRLVEDDAMARKAMATEWETVGLKPVVVQHHGDPVPESPAGPRLLLGARMRKGTRAITGGNWSAVTEREDPRLILDLLRLTREARRRERRGVFVAYGFCLPGIWIASNGADLPQVLVLAALFGILGTFINALLLGLMPWTAGELDED